MRRPRDIEQGLVEPDPGLAQSLVDAAVAALLASRVNATSHRVVLNSASVDPGRWTCPASVVLKDRELARAIRGPTPPQVIGIQRLSPTLLRALREHPVAVLVVLGALPSDELEALAGLDQSLVLGPRASLRVGSGNLVILAHNPGELEGLCRATGAESVRLALSPTPSWLHRLGSAEPLAGCQVIGFVEARQLSVQTAQWARRSDPHHVLVPVGVPPDPADSDDVTDRTSIVVAQTLERFTGPVFPAPRVLALVAADRASSSAKAATSAAPDLGLWSQARRAMPWIAANVGMEQPWPEISLATPTAAFLAQHTLLGARAAQDLLDRTPLSAPTLETDGLARAQEVLRSAGQTLTDQESKVVLRGLGLGVTRQAVANSASGAAGFADRIGYPVVLKALSPDLRRRSDVGGIVLQLATAAAVRRAYATIVENIEHQAPMARLDGVLVSEMLDEGLDIECRVERLPSGDPIISGQVVGSSSTPPSWALCPLRAKDALLLAHAVLGRVALPQLRRQTDPDVPGLAGLFLRLSQLLEATGDRIESMTLGPVRLAEPERGYVTLDARITQAPHLEGL